MITRRTTLQLLLGTSVAGVLAACASQQTRSSAPSLPTKPIDLVLGHFVPTNHEYHAKLLEPWARDVEERSRGRLRIVIHPGGALGPAPAQYKNVTAGAMDIALGVQSYTPGRFALTEGFELPFLWPTAVAATRALHVLYRSMPELRAEYADSRMLSIWTNGPAHVMTTRKPVTTLQDLRGLKLRSPGPIHNKVIEALGAIPLTLPITDTYDALERGVAGGTVTAPSVFTSFNLADVVKFSSAAHFTVASFFLAMNPQKWELLAPEDQRVLEESTGEMLAIKAAEVSDETDRTALEIARNKGVELMELAPDELAGWQAATAATSEQWARDVQARGLPGQQMLQQLRQVSAQS
jgi:TRAP-type C4-dicarboxylate transport system substrate-binding protein